MGGNVEVSYAAHSKRATEEAVLGYMREISSMAFLAHYNARGFGGEVARETSIKINYAFLLINGATTPRPEYNLQNLLRKDSEEDKLVAQHALWTADVGISFKSRQVVGMIGSMEGIIIEPESEFKMSLALLRGRTEDTAGFV